MPARARTHTHTHTHLVCHPSPRRLRHRVRDGPDEAVEREVGHELLPLGHHVAGGRAQEAEDNRQDVDENRLLDVETDEPGAARRGVSQKASASTGVNWGGRVIAGTGLGRGVMLVETGDALAFVGGCERVCSSPPEHLR